MFFMFFIGNHEGDHQHVLYVLQTVNPCTKSESHLPSSILSPFFVSINYCDITLALPITGPQQWLIHKLIFHCQLAFASTLPTFVFLIYSLSTSPYFIDVKSLRIMWVWNWYLNANIYFWMNLSFLFCNINSCQIVHLLLFQQLYGVYFSWWEYGQHTFTTIVELLCLILRETLWEMIRDIFYLLLHSYPWYVIFAFKTIARKFYVLPPPSNRHLYFCTYSLLEYRIHISMFLI